MAESADMSKIDAGTLTNLDLFLLALLDSGINTVYQLLAKANISPGASNPSLKRLESRSLVIRGASTGSRSRQEFRLTAAGRKQLKSGLRAALAKAETDPPADLESVARLVALAVANRWRSSAATILRAAMKERAVRIEHSRLIPYPEQPALLATYHSVLAQCTSASLDAEFNALAQIARGYLPRRSQRRNLLPPKP